MSAVNTINTLYKYIIFLFIFLFVCFFIDVNFLNKLFNGIARNVCMTRIMFAVICSTLVLVTIIADLKPAIHRAILLLATVVGNNVASD